MRNCLKRFEFQDVAPGTDDAVVRVGKRGDRPLLISGLLDEFGRGGAGQRIHLAPEPDQADDRFVNLEPFQRFTLPCVTCHDLRQSSIQPVVILGIGHQRFESRLDAGMRLPEPAGENLFVKEDVRDAARRRKRQTTAGNS